MEDEGEDELLDPRSLIEILEPLPGRLYEAAKKKIAEEQLARRGIPPRSREMGINGNPKELVSRAKRCEDLIESLRRYVAECRSKPTSVRERKVWKAINDAIAQIRNQNTVGESLSRDLMTSCKFRSLRFCMDVHPATLWRVGCHIEAK